LSKKFQVVGVGNAKDDVLSQCSDEFLVKAGVEKGIMQLTDMARGVELYAQVGPAKEISGGSAANSIAAAAQLGGARCLCGQGQGRPVGGDFRP